MVSVLLTGGPPDLERLWEHDGVEVTVDYFGRHQHFSCKAIVFRWSCSTKVAE